LLKIYSKSAIGDFGGATDHHSAHHRAAVADDPDDPRYCWRSG
jgi:hypothetical protein